MPDKEILQVQNVKKYFGGLRAVDGISFSVEAGQIYSIIGPNGAGKTTLFNCINGFLPLTSGEIFFVQTPVANRSPHWISSLGMARTFQNIRIFPEMSVLENTLVGGHLTYRYSLWDALLLSPFALHQEKKALEEALQWLEFVGLSDYADQKAKNLPYGLRKRLEIARALMLHPKILLMDEPAAGLNPSESRNLMGLIQQIREKGITILLIEHDMKVVMGISDQILVLNYGLPIAEGSPQEIQGNPRVIDAYLGENKF